MQFKAKSENELSRFDSLPDGEYPFTVMESSEQASKSQKNLGKMMVKLKLNVHGPNFDKHVYDYFADWFSEWKLKHFCESVGLGKSYEAGTLDATQNLLQGRQGFVRLKSESDPQYGEKNVVDDYVVLPEKPSVASPPEDPDDVPF